MLTLRVTPPRLIGRRMVADPRDLTALYVERLRANWSAADRALAAMLSRAASVPARRFGAIARAHGWDDAEEALNEDAPDRVAHLGMQARKGLNRAINAGAYPLDANPLKNKRLFAERCRATGLPAPVGFEGDAAALGRWLAGEEAVIVKPNFASKGSGVDGFFRAESGWQVAGRRLDEGQAAARIGRALGAGAVVQRIATTHEALRPLSPGALPTLRVMTAVNETGAIEACGRMIRLSGGGPRAVDNFNAGNLVAAVGEHGRMAVAFRRVAGALERLERHPVTGAGMLRAEIPDVAEAEALAIRAHRLLAPQFCVVGWDVGLTGRGPTLIEGNWNPGSDIIQLTSGLGLGDLRLGAIYRHHICETPDAVWARARPIETEPRRGRLGDAGLAPPSARAIA